MIDYCDKLDRLISDYELQYQELIYRALAFAAKVHKDVKRKSGEPYIIHPLAVACILAEMKADADTIAAGLLHDTIEDGKEGTKEALESEFNPTIVKLVSGVTNMKQIDFNNDKRLANAETNRKIMESINQDIRILVIKLADRLHNMRTMEYQTREKQIIKSTETMDFYVPLAEHIGEYTFKKELEDLSFKYLYPEEYKKINKLIKEQFDKYNYSIQIMRQEIKRLLFERNCNDRIIFQIKGVKALSDRLKIYNSIDDVHDLFTFKIIAGDNRVESCYEILNAIENLYKGNVVTDRKRDFIAHPKDNMYRSLHTNVINSEGRKVQIQIKTKEMYMINAYGLPAYWSLMSLNHPEEQMQKDISDFKFFKKLIEIIESNYPTDIFNSEVNEQILSDKIKVYDINNNLIELPVNSTPVDFYYLTNEYPIDFISAIVTDMDGNKKRVEANYKLKNGDKVEIIDKENLYGPQIDLMSYSHNKHTKNRLLGRL